MAFLRDEVNSFHREDYYLAQIACEIRRVLAKNPKKYKITDFILPFGGNNNEDVKPKPKAKKIKTAISKRFWGAALGMLPGMKPADPKKPPKDKK